MFCAVSDLRTESDVELKLIMPMLVAAFPSGCGFNHSEIYTKENLRHFDIDKGRSGKLYRPDFVVQLNGMPVLAIEAKAPGEDVAEGLREARLYAAELNAIYRSDINPCVRVFCSNGTRLFTSPWDQQTPDVDIAFGDVNPASQAYHDLIQVMSRATLIKIADRIGRRFRQDRYWRAIDQLGGLTARDESIGYNPIGKELAFDFEHIFNPQSPQQRAHIVKNAYVTSQRRRHYADEIERVVHRAVPAAMKVGELISDTQSPAALLRVFGRGKELQNKLLLLVGAVGSGKSTFIDYFREVQLPSKLDQSIVWINVDVNKSPESKDVFERWMCERISAGLRNSDTSIDFDEPSIVKKVYSVELNLLERRVLSNFSADHPKRAELIAEQIQRLDADHQAATKALARFLCGDRNKLLVIVMDNCDKGDAEEQLAVFQIVRWLQSWLTCLVFLPIRDVTYDVYQAEPPLDTVIKDYVFRIEPPPFTTVLRKRIDLALAELNRNRKQELLSYTLDGNIMVQYPASDLGMYLGCLYKSIFEHDALLRRMLIGLADRNIRRAIEIFIEFCKSGHIRAAHIFKIRQLRGEYALPLDVVMRVLLRLNRRFYDGTTAIVRNLFQCDPDCSAPSNFSRYMVLKWLEAMWKDKGPTGVKGFHRGEAMLKDLGPLGIDSRVLWEDLRFLVEVGCVATEHQRREIKSEGDLISLSASGRAHLRLVSHVGYLAACAEDAWIGEEDTVRGVAFRIGRSNSRKHYSDFVQAKNADVFAKYLVMQHEMHKQSGTVFIAPAIDASSDILGFAAKTQRVLDSIVLKSGWKNAELRFPIGTVVEGRIDGVAKFGVFVMLQGGPVGLVHLNTIPTEVSVASFSKGAKVTVKVVSIDDSRQQLALELVTFS